MNVIRCPKGHFYDDDIFKKCPHCGGAGDETDRLIMPNLNPVMDTGGMLSLDSVVNTASYKSEKRRIMGWLVAIDGIQYGSFEPLYEGENKLEEAVIRFDPEKMKFFIDVKASNVKIDLDSRTLSSNEYIHHHSKIRIYGYTYMLVELLRDGFNWDKKTKSGKGIAEPPMNLKEMKKCSICGTYVKKGEAYCDACGAPMK